MNAAGDQGALKWLKGELDESVRRARKALEEYVEGSGSADLMTESAGHLHQVHGVLQMINLQGGAMLAEELELVCKALASGEVKDREQVAESLMMGMIRLPDYLEKIQAGAKDSALVVLPMMNDLRAARGAEQLAESALFDPLLDARLKFSGDPGKPNAQLQKFAHAARPRYQRSMLAWFKGADVQGGLDNLQKVMQMLERTAGMAQVKRMFRIVRAGLILALEDPAGSGNPIKRLFGQMDREVKRLIQQGEPPVAAAPPLDMMKGFLFYLASSQSTNPAVLEIRQEFRLDGLIASREEVKSGREELHAPNRELLESLRAAIGVDLTVIKDGLDLFIRSKSTDPDRLLALHQILRRVADTLGVVGQGALRQRLMRKADKVMESAKGGQLPNESDLLGMAGDILFVEASLENLAAAKTAPPRGSVEVKAGSLEMPTGEYEKLLTSVVREVAIDMSKSKDAILSYIKQPDRPEALEEVPKRFRTIAGAFEMLKLFDAAGLLRAIAGYVANEIIAHRITLDQERLNTFADAITSIEYFMETVSEGRGVNEEILDIARQALMRLGSEEPSTAEVQEQEAAEAVLRKGAEVEIERGEMEVSSDESAPVAAEAPGRVQDEVDPEILQIFIEESKEELDVIREYYPRWRGNRDDRDALITFRRSFHTLKGSGRLVGAVTIGEIAWSIENMLNRIIDQTISTTPEVIDLLDEAIDKLPGMIQCLEEGTQPEEDIHALIDHAFALSELKREPRAERAAAPKVVAEPPVEVPAPQEPLVEVAPEIEAVAVTPEGAEAAPEEVMEMEAAPVAFEEIPEEISEEEAETAPTTLLEEVDPEILEIFLEESKEVLETIREYYPLWRADQKNKDALITFRRSFHTLKGSGRLVGAHTIGELGWSIENLINRVIDQSIRVNDEVLGLLDETIQVLPGLIECQEKGIAPRINVQALMDRAFAIAEPSAAAGPASVAASKKKHELKPAAVAETAAALPMTEVEAPVAPFAPPKTDQAETPEAPESVTFTLEEGVSAPEISLEAGREPAEAEEGAPAFEEMEGVSAEEFEQATADIEGEGGEWEAPVEEATEEFDLSAWGAEVGESAPEIEMAPEEGAPAFEEMEGVSVEEFEQATAEIEGEGGEWEAPVEEAAEEFDLSAWGTEVGESAPEIEVAPEEGAPAFEEMEGVSVEEFEQATADIEGEGGEWEAPVEEAAEEFDLSAWGAEVEESAPEIEMAPEEGAPAFEEMEGVSVEEFEQATAGIEGEGGESEAPVEEVAEEFDLSAWGAERDEAEPAFEMAAEEAEPTEVQTEAVAFEEFEQAGADIEGAGPEPSEEGVVEEFELSAWGAEGDEAEPTFEMAAEEAEPTEVQTEAVAFEEFEQAGADIEGEGAGPEPTEEGVVEEFQLSAWGAEGDEAEPAFEMAAEEAEPTEVPTEAVAFDEFEQEGADIEGEGAETEPFEEGVVEEFDLSAWGAEADETASAFEIAAEEGQAIFEEVEGVTVETFEPASPADVEEATAVGMDGAAALEDETGETPSGDEVTLDEMDVTQVAPLRGTAPDFAKEIAALLQGELEVPGDAGAESESHPDEEIQTLAEAPEGASEELPAELEEVRYEDLTSLMTAMETAVIQKEGESSLAPEPPLEAEEPLFELTEEWVEAEPPPAESYEAEDAGLELAGMPEPDRAEGMTEDDTRLPDATVVLDRMEVARDAGVMDVTAPAEIHGEATVVLTDVQEGAEAALATVVAEREEAPKDQPAAEPLEMIDPEILEIFLEEAKEVLDTIREYFPLWRQDQANRNALTTFRRSFHTLKGSGRLVGAETIGELGWAVENLLNRIIDQTVSTSPEVFGFLQDVVDALPNLIEAQERGTAPQVNVRSLMERAGALAEPATVASEGTEAEPKAEPRTEEVSEIAPETAPAPLGEGGAISTGAASEDAGVVEPEKAAEVEAVEADLARMGIPEADDEIQALMAELGVEEEESFLSETMFEEEMERALADMEPEPVPTVADVEAGLSGAQAPIRLDPTLLEIFEGESRNHIETLRRFVEECGRGTGACRLGPEVSRAFHTLHGSAHMAEVTPVALVAAALEGYIKELQTKQLGLDPLLPEFVNRSIGYFEGILAAINVPGAKLPDWKGFIEELSGRAQTFLGKPAVVTEEKQPVPEAPKAEPAPAFTPTSVAAPAAAEGEGPVAIESDDDELVAVFLEEAHELLESLDFTVNEWRKAPEDIVPLAELKRTLHTLKGSSRLAGIAPLGDLSHAFETFVIDVEKGVIAPSTEVCDYAQMVTDFFVKQIEEVRTTRRVHSADGLIRGLAHFGKKPPARPTIAAAAPPAAAPKAHAERGAKPEVVQDVIADPELVDIFMEEARDLLDSVDRNLEAWKADLGELSPITELQRTLHTLKGSSRLAGVTVIGDLAHAFESLLVAVRQKDLRMTPEVFAVIQATADRLGQQVDEVRDGRGVGSANALIGVLEGSRGAIDPRELMKRLGAVQVGAKGAAVAEPATDGEKGAAVKPAAPAPKREKKKEEEPAVDAASQRQIAREQVRVRPELLDRMVNFAGEISIYRARLEEQNSTLGFNMTEMAQTVSRLHGQLRQLEIETEAQMLFRFEHERGVEAQATQGLDPLEMDRFSTMQQVSRSLMETVNDLGNINDALDGLHRTTDTLLLQQSRVSADLQDGLMRTRMVPFNTVMPRLRRLVRQTSTSLGKKAELIARGENAEIDRNILERMIGPIEHLLRNSLSHGVESPERRKAAGKPEAGTITFALEREGNDVLVTVADDGAGLNLDAIRTRAIERGLLKEGAEVDDDDLMQFILSHGFSTKSEVDQVSGRGVGMDVVVSEIKQLGGDLEIKSAAGKGSTFLARLPLTLALTDALLLRLGEDYYAAPYSGLEGVVRIRRQELIDCYEGRQKGFEYAGNVYSVRYLGTILGAGALTLDEQQRYLPMLLVRTGEHRVAFQVDELLGNREIVVKSLGRQLSSVRWLAGGTILADGRVALILDAGALVRMVAAMTVIKTETKVKPKEEPANRPTLVMVVDDSITVRKVTTRLLKRHGMEVVTAKDGVDAVAQLQDIHPDIMLLDIEMPRMDGYELARHIQFSENLKDIPIIMITSRTGDKHRNIAMELGVKRYLGKPYQETQLLENIQSVLAEVRAEA